MAKFRRTPRLTPFVAGLLVTLLCGQFSFSAAAVSASEAVAAIVANEKANTDTAADDAAAAEPEAVPDMHDVYIGGFSPVSYFTENKAELGSVEFAVAHDGRVYYLTSQAQVELFEADPAHYQPRYEVCPFSLTTGKRRALDPTNFKVIGDTLLLFHKSPGVDGLAGWNASELSDEELLDRADNQVVLLKF